MSGVQLIERGIREVTCVKINLQLRLRTLRLAIIELTFRFFTGHFALARTFGRGHPWFRWFLDVSRRERVPLRRQLTPRA